VWDPKEEKTDASEVLQGMTRKKNWQVRRLNKL
jgi:hypothetical protein